ncbi:structural maintenance of chromosomes protein 5 [Lingula anatina]|uniref:Structural maintenance of chromosomes protein 5 n=1 Tax=Lingula anatina TaxID=7574 RepID=A0A1S3GY52_LINAN|nr:structural maintenance of chromosomes protein 5 [Lingula anatina]|eukprot:XP_013378683.1 structural maintenance of chromosomes protein 5 [Lingula anatina]
MAKPKARTNQRQGETQRDGSEGFGEGSIVRVKLENFVTYDVVEFRPGPHLNVIIGPNGTGKSTLVCAICLGVAGKPSVLNRAPNSAGYIKYGCQRAIIELELHNPDGENYVIRREISKNKSDWSVNGRQATQKAVEELASRLKIQVGNLCQFLPQEKVGEFARMTKQELLENTEKAAGPENMYENHQKLKMARQESKQLEARANSVIEHYEDAVQKNSRLEGDVQQYQQRERYRQKIELLQKKRPWVEYEEKRSQFTKEKERKHVIEEHLKKARAAYAPMQAKLNDAEKKVEEINVLMKEKYNVIKEHAKQAANKSKNIENETDKMQEIQDDLNAKRSQEQSRQKRVKNLHAQLDAIQAEYDNVGDEEDVQPAIERVSKDMQDTSRSMTQASHRGSAVKMELDQLRGDIRGKQDVLNQLQDVSNRRLLVLQQRHRHTYEAVMWLRSNRHEFNGVIHEPMIVTLNMKDPRYAKYVEGHVSFNDMRAFICEDQDDANKFLARVRDEQGLRVNAVTAPRVSLNQFKASHPLQYYSKYGFHSYLKDLFECPDPVMAFLCAMYKVHQIPVGDASTRDRVEVLLREHPDLNTFYTEDHQYNVKRSKYGNRERSSRVTELRQPSLLTSSSDVAREQALAAELQGLSETYHTKEKEFKDHEATYKQLEIQLNKLRQEKKDLQSKRDVKRRLAEKIRAKKEIIQRTEGEAINIESEEAKANQKIHKINLRKIDLLSDLKKHTQECLQLSMEKVRLALQHSEAMREVSDIESQLREQSTSLRTQERECEEFKENLRRMKELAKRLLADAKAATGTREDQELSAEMKKAFESCPNRLEDIDAAIHEEQARADLTLAVDDSVIRDFNQRKREIRRLETEKEEKIKALEDHKKEIEELRRGWIEPLEELVEKINKNFGDFFSQMNCVGEVDLDRPENPEDYEKYGIRIKVKYRANEQLRELTPGHQSGGECSVATVLYLMALQELSMCPFRCVDEINQGMDASNERKVFELVVHTMSRPHTGQYFLLTPKLLPDLKYSNHMNVLCVYNGPNMMNHADWNIKKFIRRRAQIP